MFDFYNPDNSGEVVALPAKKRRSSKKIEPASPSLNSKRSKNKKQPSGDIEEMEMRMQKKGGNRGNLDILQPSQNSSSNKKSHSNKKLLDDLSSIANPEESKLDESGKKRRSIRF